eukprot:TRINITY_DN12073_c0_g1_i1.p1 TRINITY_DN12073_c0_g1~~TRINITY_DN12073_c0_g1_i1.p1  ORF type:complete len:280 (+),score=60.23 TRINITY_DN12073_c0_g1_i1:37-876(+)
MVEDLKSQFDLWQKQKPDNKRLVWKEKNTQDDNKIELFLILGKKNEVGETIELVYPQEEDDVWFLETQQAVNLRSSTNQKIIPWANDLNEYMMGMEKISFSLILSKILELQDRYTKKTDKNKKRNKTKKKKKKFDDDFFYDYDDIPYSETGGVPHSIMDSHLNAYGVIKQAEEANKSCEEEIVIVRPELCSVSIKISIEDVIDQRLEQALDLAGKIPVIVTLDFSKLPVALNLNDIFDTLKGFSAGVTFTYSKYNNNTTQSTKWIWCQISFNGNSQKVL